MAGSPRIAWYRAVYGVDVIMWRLAYRTCRANSSGARQLGRPSYLTDQIVSLGSRTALPTRDGFGGNDRIVFGARLALSIYRAYISLGCFYVKDGFFPKKPPLTIPKKGLRFVCVAGVVFTFESRACIRLGSWLVVRELLGIAPFMALMLLCGVLPIERVVRTAPVRVSLGARAI